MIPAMIGPETPLGQAFSKAILDIGKLIPPGTASPQGEDNFMKEMAMKRQQMGPHRAAVASQMPAAPAPPAPAAAA